MMADVTLHHSPVLSILVPVYKTELYVRRCIDSILDLNYKDFELIIVDDGTPDMAGEICDEYKRKDNRIIVIHQENAGLPAARNTAIAVAKGKYIGFVDSDDWIDSDMYTEFIEYMECHSECDICIGTMKAVYSTGIEKQFFGTRLPPMLMNGREALLRMFKNDIFGWSIWDKLYRGTLFKKFRCREDICNGEDAHTSFRLFSKARNVWYNPLCHYHYYINNAGITEKVRAGDSEKDTVLTVWEDLLASPEASDDVEIKRSLLNVYAMDLQTRIMCSLACGNEKKAKDLFEKCISLSSNAKAMFIGENTWIFKELREYIYAIRLSVIKLSSICSEVYIYGTTMSSILVKFILEDQNITFCGYVVSDGYLDREYYAGIHVKELSQICPRENIGIIFSMSEKSHKKVLPLVKKAGFKNFIFVEGLRQPDTKIYSIFDDNKYVYFRKY